MPAPKQPAPVPVTAIRALTPLEVDNVRIEEGDTAEIRSELVDGLLAIGAIELAPARAQG